MTPPQKPAVSVTSKATGRAAVSWKKVDGAKGYRIYRSTSPNGPFKQIKTITKGKTITFTDKNVQSGTTYYYKVRAYTVNPDGSRAFGKPSTAKSVKIK